MPELSLDGFLVGVVGAMLLLLLFAFLRHSPKVAMIAWLVGIFFVPVWVGQSVGAYFPAFVIIGLLATLSLLPTPLAIRPTVVDVVFLGVVLAAIGLYALKLTTRSATFDLLVTWATAYTLGRLVVHLVDARWLYGAFGAFGAVAGVLALVEFVTGRNLFISYLANSSSLFGFWGTLQPRGSVIRAEGAFGHSIALGITLGVAACLVLGSSFRPWVKTALAIACAAGAAVTFSRSGMVTALLGVLLMCVFLKGTLSRRYRAAVLVLGTVAVAIAARPLLAVFASSDEAEGSALYRAQLLGLVRSMKPFGITGEFSVTTSNQASVGGFGSVDNALLLIGLIFGWVPLLCVLLAALAAAVTVVSGRATPATIAVVAQLPALVTVAFITQYAAVAWFTAGLAVGSQLLARSRRDLDPPLAAVQAPARPESAHA